MYKVKEVLNYTAQGQTYSVRILSYLGRNEYLVYCSEISARFTAKESELSRG